MNAWRPSAVGVLIPVHQRVTAGAAPWPRPAGWASLPADIRAAWDARWQRVPQATQRTA